MHHRAREGDGARIALRTVTRDHRPTGISQPERLRDLVERLAHRVVDGGAERFVVAPALHVDEHGVAARHERHHGRWGEIGTPDAIGVQVAFQVVYADERHVRRPRRALRKRHAHHERADEPRRICDGHRGKIAPAKRFHPEVFRRDLEAFVAHAADGLDVLAACDFGNDAAEARVEVDLACHHVRGKRPFPVDDRRGGLVA